MNSYGSFILLANLFAFVSNAENICISMSGNSNVRFRGTYEQKSDSNGNAYYQNIEANCNDEEYIYNLYGTWRASDKLGSSRYSLRCPTEDISSPADCGVNWSGATSATSKSGSCDEIVLNCNVIEISGYTDYINDAYTKVADNLYIDSGNSRYFQYVSRFGSFVVTANDDRTDCSPPPAYLRSYETDAIGDLQPGDSVEVSIYNGESPTATIKCSTNAPTPLPASSAADTMCISRETEGSNVPFYGTYDKATDSNGNLYYQKGGCDGTKYVYLQEGEWRGSSTLYGSNINIRCPSDNIAAPYQCSTSYINGNTGSDPDLSVTSGSCPEFDVILSCNIIQITGSGYTEGTYSQIDTNLYQRSSDGLLFQRYERGDYYAVATTDSRLACSGPSSYLRTYDSRIDSLTNGDSIENVNLDYPVGGTATINCLTNAPTPLPAASAADNLCISRETDGSNTAFYGTYDKKTDSNGNVYYEKDACDSTPEYIYLQSGQWIASQTLYGSSTYLKCPASNVAIPYQCPIPYINGGNSDPDLSVVSGACPEFDVILSCNAIQITGSGSSGTNGIYSKINTNLYQKSSNGRMFQRYERGDYYAVATTDSRLACSSPSAYLRTYDSGIDSLTNGNSITVNLDYPVGGTATINCLSSAS